MEVPIKKCTCKSGKAKKQKDETFLFMLLSGTEHRARTRMGYTLFH